MKHAMALAALLATTAMGAAQAQTGILTENCDGRLSATSTSSPNPPYGVNFHASLVNHTAEMVIVRFGIFAGMRPAAVNPHITYRVPPGMTLPIAVAIYPGADTEAIIRNFNAHYRIRCMPPGIIGLGTASALP